MSKPPSTNASAPPAPWQQQQQQHGAGYGAPYNQAPPSSIPYAGSYGPPPAWGQQANTSAYQQPYQQNPGSYPGYPPSGYGYPPQQPYGYQPSLFPAGTDPDIIQAFQGADRDGSGLIDDVELQKALSGTQPFSMRTVHLMMHLFGPKDMRKMAPKEFATLWKALKDWKAVFQRFDRDCSGSIDKTEMREALLSLGYAISPPILDCLLQKYDRTGLAKAMDYDSFVECGLIVKGLTESFKEKDTQLKGAATMDYQTFMLMVLPFVVA